MNDTRGDTDDEVGRVGGRPLGLFGLSAGYFQRQLNLCKEDMMPYVLFHDHFPETAERETRTVTVLKKSPSGLPPGHYSLLEMFCDEPKCDCRRVMFYVVSSRRRDLEAVVAYGWESRVFYAKWLHDDDPRMIDELEGPVLNLGSPQSELAPAVLEMIEQIILPDRAYMERVKRHYAMVRKRIDRKTAPPKVPARGRRRKRPVRRRMR